MACYIKRAYANEIQIVTAAVVKILGRKVSVKRQNEIDLRDEINHAQFNKAELLKQAQVQQIDRFNICRP